MDPHPDFADIALPREAMLTGVRLTALGPEVLEEDYDAVMASKAALAGFWGDWPSGLTREEDALDLAWHEREFTLKRSFSWVVRGMEGEYLGCFYLFPDPGRRGAAEAVLWIVDRADRLVRMEAIHRAVSAWIRPQLPPGLVLRWRTSPGLPPAAGQGTDRAAAG